MRIAIISTMAGQAWTGSEELWAATALAAREAGHEVFVSLWKWDTLPPRVAALQKLGVEVRFRKRPGRLPTLGGIVKRLAGKRVKLPQPLRFSAYREVIEFRPDVILLSQGWTYEFRDNPDLTAQLFACKIPLMVVNQANMEEPISHEMRDDLLRFAPRAAQIGFVAAGNLRAVQRQLAVALPNALVVQNPVNLTDLSAVTFPEPVEGVWNLASVGRLDSGHKGQDVLLEALSDPVWKARAWKLRFYGSGPEKDYIAALIRHYDLSDKVEFGGYLPDVRAIWEQNHLLLMPSRVEGTPLALIEAMLCGRAALVTDIAGHLEWIEEGKNGFIAEAPSAHSLQRALERAWQQRDQWQEFGLCAHQTASQKYDRKAGETLFGMLKTVAATPASASSVTSVNSSTSHPSQNKS